MSDNPSIIDWQADKDYILKLKKRKKFICDRCEHERPLKGSQILKLTETWKWKICKKCAKEIGF
jgi:transcription elongation factor Elf1